MPEAPAKLQSERQKHERSGRRVIGALLGFGALLLIIAVTMAVITMGRIAEDTARVEHTLQVETAVNRITALNERLETGRRGFLIQPSPDFARVIRITQADFDSELAGLRTLAADNPVQVERMVELARLAEERDAIVDSIFSDPQGSRAAIGEQDFDAERGVRITNEIRTIVYAMREEEKRLLIERNRHQLDSLIQFYVVGGIAVALLIAVLTAAVVLVMRYNRDLTGTEAQLRQVNEGLEVAVAARTTELSRANEEIQRFAYIVSHDLRSPLVNVLGFTSELDEARKTLHTFLTRLFEEQPGLRDEAAWLAVEEDLPEALGFIRTSTEKMDRLINSILELSRQGRRQLRPEWLDMTELAENVAATMHQRAEAAGAEVTVGSIPPLESDHIAVEQIVSNLVENALKYLSPARPGQVQVEGRRIGKRIAIDVTDNGRGIAPADHERIFDLFRRAGAQDQPGEGIGLANVRALTYRLGGKIEVELQLDEGARFTLSLPEKFSVSEPN